MQSPDTLLARLPREFISAVEFGVFAPAEIKRLSVCSISESSMYNCSLPATNSVVDFRMGSVTQRMQFHAAHAVSRSACNAAKRPPPSPAA